MFSVTVSQHCMIAHSLRGAVFGPAQQLHGATYVVEATFLAEQLDADGIVVDIGRAGELLAQVLAPLNYQNLDTLPRFAERNTTTEVLAQCVFEDVRARIRAGALGAEAARRLHWLRIVLRETPQAWAGFEGPLADST